MIDPKNPDYGNTPVSQKRPGFGYAPLEKHATPYVTIITPFYNTGPVFHETARSVLGQSFQQWEWLIVNDGSTNPDSLSVLDEYRNRDSRIRVIDLRVNCGPSVARNTGFNEARAQLIVQLDSDNLLESTAIEKWLWFLESYQWYGFVKGYSVGFGAQEYLWQRGFHDGEAFLSENLVDVTSMIRKSVHEATGGYDKNIRHGLEDWDFWLRCANAGYWGGTIPEYLDWYRRRPSHSDRWATWDEGERQRAFREQLRQRYPHLWNGGFPHIQLKHQMPYDSIRDELPCENRLLKDKPRLLMILPWLTMGGADKFNLDVLRQLVGRGWQVTIATTLKGDSPWFPEFARYTSDIFILQNFLRLVDYPRFLRYLIQSRRIDVVLISHSELGYLLLPYLRSYHHDVVFVDYNHIEEEYYKNGNYPRAAVDYQDMLDLNIVSSEHLRSWMIKRGAAEERIRVCYTNVDPEEWCPDPEERSRVRSELGLDGAIPAILYAARICAQKQPRVFAETMLRLVQEGRSFVALVAGDGPDFEWLRSFVERRDLGGYVRLLGAVTNERVKQLMSASDIFFLPSQWEGISLAIYEAMAVGAAIVGADVGGQRELVTPECGVLIPRSDEETEAQEYARILTKLLANPEWRQQLGQAARMRVSTHFRLDQMGERMVSLLAEAKQLHVKQPRQVPCRGLARACAAQAVEYTRLQAVADELWAESQRLSAIVREVSERLVDPQTVRWRVLAKHAVTQFPLPYYLRMLKGKLKLIVPASDGRSA